MPMPNIAVVFVSAVVLGLASASAFATDRADDPAIAAHARMHASDALASLQLEHDPLARVYIVMSRASHAHMPDLVRSATPKMDRQGNRLVLAEIRAHQLSRITERIHQRERRCGGYFAFSTRAQAEAFLRNERSRPPLSRKSPAMMVEYSIDSQATVSPWLDQVQHTNLHNTISTCRPTRTATTPAATAAMPRCGCRAPGWVSPRGAATSPPSCCPAATVRRSRR